MLKNRITNITPAKREQKAILKESLLHHFADFFKRLAYYAPFFSWARNSPERKCIKPVRTRIHIFKSDQYLQIIFKHRNDFWKILILSALAFLYRPPKKLAQTPFWISPQESHGLESKLEILVELLSNFFLGAPAQDSSHHQDRPGFFTNFHHFAVPKIKL